MYVASVEKASLDFAFRLSTLWVGCHALYSLDGDTSNTIIAKDPKQASGGLLGCLYRGVISFIDQDHGSVCTYHSVNNAD